ncbi:MAG: beta-lactamase domain protein [Thermoanaerobacter sp.]|nr:beta-lactamase domain protein [Thermoanaerobacter sp.]
MNSTLKKGIQIAAWIFSTLFLLCGFIGLFNDPLAGLIMILMGTVLLPPLTGIVGQRFGFTPKLWMKGLVIFALFIIFGMVARPVDKPAEKDNPTAQTKETRVTTVTSDTASDTSTKNIESQSIDTTAKTETVSTQQKQKNPTVQSNEKKELSGTLAVHFIDVGQADSILINTGSVAMLIDAGNNADAELVVNYIKGQGIKTLDYIIGTHPHEDHIGGMDAVVNSFGIGKVILPKVQSNTKTFEDLLKAISNKGLKITSPVPGTKYSLGEAEFTILAPNGSSYENVNDYSVVIKLQFGKTSFLLTGDAGVQSEGEMLSKDFDLKADLLKVGHHGSRYSTSEDFLKVVSPKFAVISVGKDNSYGHPAEETIKKILDTGIQLYRTDESGTIIATSDGNIIKIDIKASPVKAQAPPQTVTVDKGESKQTSKNVDYSYIGNKNTKKFHLPTCRSLPTEQNRIYFKTREEAVSAGYVPCKICKP